MSSPTPPSMSARDLEAFLHEKIPLSRAMGVSVGPSDPGHLALEAPLAPNVNHLGTAFGGSLHALPTLACYTVVWTLLFQAGLAGHVVVKHSEASYRQPVTGRLRAVCALPPPDHAAQFLDTLRRHKKARMALTAIIAGVNGKPAVEFAGVFVAIL
jgi:thioesterase domain-containing protein